jgi:HEAT repeat protein
MGLFDFFSSDKGARDEKTVDRLKKKLLNKHHQTAERKRAIELLAGLGSEAAISALLYRFSFHTPGTIVDEEEKDMVFDALKEAGAKTIRPLEEFIQKENTVYWPIRALAEIAGEERAVDTVLASLDGIQDRFEQSMDRMTQLVSCLRDFQSPKVMARLIALLEDDAEEIRFLALDGLSTFDEHEEAVDAIVSRLLVAEETGRIKTFVTDLLLERRWNVRKNRKLLSEQLPAQYFVDDTGVVQRR